MESAAGGRRPRRVVVRPLQGGAFRRGRAGSCAWGVPGCWSRGGGRSSVGAAGAV